MPPRGRRGNRRKTAAAAKKTPATKTSEPKAGPSGNVEPELYARYGDSDDEDPIPVPRPSSTNIFKLLSGREVGITCNAGFPNSLFRGKAKDFRRIKKHTFHRNQTAASYNAYFSRPGKNGSVSAFFIEIERQFYSSVTLLHYDLTRVPRNTNWIVLEKRIVDACQVSADPDIFVCAVPYAEGGGGKYYIAATNSHNMITNREKVQPNSKPIWCCTSNMRDRKFALGCNKEILISTTESVETIITVKDDIFGIAYNEIGNVLNLGTLDGEFQLLDLRTPDTVSRKKIDNNIIDDVLVLDDENYCVVSGIRGLISKIDLRMMKPVVNYPGHNRKSKKIPLSVNETFDYLCASGDDDRTRVWCLRSGELLNALTHPTTYTARATILRHDPFGSIHLLQDEFVHIYSMIC